MTNHFFRLFWATDSKAFKICGRAASRRATELYHLLQNGYVWMGKTRNDDDDGDRSICLFLVIKMGNERDSCVCVCVCETEACSIAIFFEIERKKPRRMHA